MYYYNVRYFFIRVILQTSYQMMLWFLLSNKCIKLYWKIKYNRYIMKNINIETPINQKEKKEIEY